MIVTQQSNINRPHPLVESKMLYHEHYFANSYRLHVFLFFLCKLCIDLLIFWCFFLTFKAT